METKIPRKREKMPDKKPRTKPPRIRRPSGTVRNVYAEKIDGKWHWKVQGGKAFAAITGVVGLPSQVGHAARVAIAEATNKPLTQVRVNVKLPQRGAFDYTPKP